MLNLSKRPRRTMGDIGCGPVRLERIYDAIRNEGIPQRFRDLLARLEAEERLSAGEAAPARDAPPPRAPVAPTPSVSN